MAKRGRPTTYTSELADQVCSRIAEGNSLRKVCKDFALPSPNTVRAWAREHEGFRGRYHQARQDQGHAYADKAADLADELLEHPDRDKANSYKVALDALKWSAAKLHPAAYGDKIELKHQHNIGLTGILNELETMRDVSPATQIEATRLLAGRNGAARGGLAGIEDTNAD